MVRLGSFRAACLARQSIPKLVVSCVCVLRRRHRISTGLASSGSVLYRWSCIDGARTGSASPAPWHASKLDHAVAITAGFG